MPVILTTFKIKPFSSLWLPFYGQKNPDIMLEHKPLKAAFIMQGFSSFSFVSSSDLSRLQKSLTFFVAVLKQTVLSWILI